MALSAIAIGAVMVEVRVAGLSGGMAASAGACAPPEGKNALSAHSAPPNEATRTSAPAAIFGAQQRAEHEFDGHWFSLHGGQPAIEAELVRHAYQIKGASRS
jgi:hypothetical protein